tara:strand:- start:104818 stop:107997 length:3180 start_codon:yes stop_codon:yes gene_type:complete
MKTKVNGILTLLLAFVVHLSFAQEKTITGNVKDQDGLPLPGVNILVIGTTNGTQTDFDGNYTISATVGETISFSYVGLKEVKMVVGAQNTLNVQMQEDAEVLGEVVVTGYGVKREKKSIGFSQQTVDGDALVKAREQDISNALAGKVSGVQIIGNSSTTFSPSEVRLRGSTNVLYVVDGIRIYNTNDINTQNVASMSVLKGSSATAIYGPDGRNGVIVITSKNAEKGAASFEVDVNTAINSVATMPEYQNEYGGGYSQIWNVFDYNAATDPASWESFDGDLYTDYFADESWGPKLDGTLARHWDSWIPGTPEFGETRPWSPSPNDVKSFYESALTNVVTLAFSKADDDYNIRTTLTHVNANGIVPNSNNKSTKFSINASYDINDKFKIFTNINYEDRYTLNNPTQGYGNIASNMNQWWQRQLDVSRLADYERNGQVVSWNIRGPRDPRPLYWDSPYFHSYENYLNEYKNSTFGKIGGTYTFNEKFNITAEARRTFHSYLADDRSTTKSLLDPAMYEEIQTRNIKNEYFAMLNYADKYLNNDLDLTASLGAELIEQNYRRLGANTVGNLTIPNFYNLSGSQDPINAYNEKKLEERRGTFIKASVGYKSTLYLDGSYRLDWSSTAQPEDNRVNTYGASASFVASQLLPKNNVLSFAKFRAGYGSAPYYPNPYKIRSVYEVGSLYQGNGRLYVNGAQENPDLVGGLRKELELGTELQFFNNRISFDLTYFNREDVNLPIPVSLDGSTGYSSITINSGKQTSKGFELGIFGDIIKTDNFNWNLGVNFATLERFVDELYTDPNTGESLDSRNLSTYGSVSLQERVGQEWGLFYGPGFATDDNGNRIYIPKSNGNYQYAIESNKLIGSLLPDFTGGFTSNMTYKNIDLNLGFDFQKGGKYYSRTERYFDHSGLSAQTAGLNDKGLPLRDPVSAGGGVHIVGVLQTGEDANGNPISDGTPVDAYVDPQDLFNSGNLGASYENNVHDATYIKLRTVRLNYSFDSKLIEKIKLKKASIGLYANNLWLIYSDLPWIDPSEIEKRNDLNWAEGGQLPDSKTIGINLNVTF